MCEERTDQDMQPSTNCRQYHWNKIHESFIKYNQDKSRASSNFNHHFYSSKVRAILKGQNSISKLKSYSYMLVKRAKSLFNIFLCKREVLKGFFPLECIYEKMLYLHYSKSHITNLALLNSLSHALKHKKCLQFRLRFANASFLQLNLDINRSFLTPFLNLHDSTQIYSFN